MENTNVLDLVTGGIAILILIGGMLMMYTTIFTTKNEELLGRLGIGTRSSVLPGKLSL